MNRQQASALIEQTFSHAFDRDRFRGFALNMLNHVDEGKAQRWNKQYVKDAFKQHVNRYERLGSYTSPESEKLDVLIVHLATESKLERARTAIRNFVADHLKTRDEKDAALVAFVSPSEKQWRFSYVKMEYATVQKESGKIGVESRLTPARRFSYIVGEGESCHTAQTRFLKLLQDTEADPALADIEEAFSVEAVTKEFFTNYADLFSNMNAALEQLVADDRVIRAEFKTKNVNTVDFAKKLMGQIVFLYFLQKKGWLGVAKGQDWGTGPRDFLRRLAAGEFGRYENFLNDILEPLFYDTLATDRGHDAWCDRFKCRIPFLNGGLFEPLGDYDWKKTDILLPNRLFTNSEFVEEGITGTGVLDVFDRYNFTVNEAEPLEKEVAIDPEMLGKVFENLIEENRRKGLGAYYTPREIVHYMCQESLINYLDSALNKNGQSVSINEIKTLVHLGEQISHYEAVEATYAVKMPKSIQKHARELDEALAAVTICDLAVGSGAFPVGMMTEIVGARCALTPYFNDVHDRTPYQFKRHAIQDSLYGVDIDPGAVEIAKLRLWLSLVVDEEDAKQIKPLPNLDYKIVVGDSLLGVEKTLFNEQLFRELETLKPLYFDATHKDKKNAYKTDINKLIHQLTTGKETFDFAIYFSEVFHRTGGFDVIVANPPYLGEKGHKEIFRLIAASSLGKRFYTGKMDLFYFFFHLALDLVREGGCVAFITTNYYVTATGGGKLRADFKSRAVVKRLVNFNEMHIFESALGQHNMISVLQKATDISTTARVAITSRTGFADSTAIGAIVGGTDPNTSYHSIPQSSLYETDANYIRLTGTSTSSATDPTQRMLAKMKKSEMRLGYAFNVNQGIVSSADKVSPKHLKKYNLVADVGDGIFVLSVDEIKRLNLAGAEARVLKPWFKNSDVHRWVTSSQTDEKLIYADKRLGNLERAPGLRRHLLRFESILDDSSSNSPYLHRPRSIDFDGPKVVAPQRSRANTFAYNAIPWFASADVYFITENAANERRLKCLVGLLNSKLYFQWFYHKGKRKGEMLELYQQPLSETPIPQLSEVAETSLARVVDKIMAAKQRDAAADTTVLEKEIDRVVYELFGLTLAEVKLVEDNVAR